MSMTKRRLVVGALVLVLFALTSAELFARFSLGLGDPPLTIRDSDIDYLFAPSRCYVRFGNNVCYNSYSMRATRDVEPRKTNGTELRVVVMGDSVVNGGALTDDAELATRIVEQRLQRRLDRPVWVANVSAGSWGPGNLLAYARKFGWFDADIAILVVSSHDLADVPEFSANLGPDFPEKTPVLALSEAVFRYLPRYLPAWPTEAGGRASTPDRPREERGRELFAQLLREARSKVEKVRVLHHPERDELKREEAQGRLSRCAELLRAEAERAGVPFVELRPYYLAATAEMQNPYRDAIHLNATGQRRLADALECVVLASLGTKAETCR